MTHDELMKQSAKTLLRWADDKTLPVEHRSMLPCSEWVLLDDDPKWYLHNYYYRIAEPPKRVPLGPEDFPPGQVHCLNQPDAFMSNEYVIIEAVTGDYVRPTGTPNIEYEQLMGDGWLRWIDGEWHPCWKEVTE